MSETALSSFVPQYIVRKVISFVRVIFSTMQILNRLLDMNPMIFLRRFCSLMYLVRCPHLFTETGFTALNEKFHKMGPSGAEQVNKHLNTYFGSLIETSNSFGGDM